MTIKEAVDYVYASYLKAEPYLDYDAPDAKKRNPELTKGILGAKNDIPTVLVTGSKGKGSVSKMIAEIMGAHRKVGMMTSPHMLTFNERFQIDGKVVSDEALVDAVSLVKPEFDQIEKTLSREQYISPMGIQAAVALELFKQNNVTFQVMECGKGVAYDDVGNVPHTYGVINRIFLEHTRELGATLSDIAANKAAIMTGNEKAVFTSAQEDEVLTILRDKAKEKKVTLYEYGTHFWCENVKYTTGGMVFDVVVCAEVAKKEAIAHTNDTPFRIENITIPLLGTHQAENCALAFAVCVAELGDAINTEKAKQNLKQLQWPGRLEIIKEEPFILLDACINRESCKKVQEVLQALNIDKVATIIAIPKDKDYIGVTEHMTDVSSAIILTKTGNPHYVFGPEQVTTLEGLGVKCMWSESVKNAILLAKKQDLPICILGTTSLITEVKALVETDL